MNWGNEVSVNLFNINLRAIAKEWCKMCQTKTYQYGDEKVLMSLFLKFAWPSMSQDVACEKCISQLRRTCYMNLENIIDCEAKSGCRSVQTIIFKLQRGAFSQ